MAHGSTWWAYYQGGHMIDTLGYIHEQINIPASKFGVRMFSFYVRVARSYGHPTFSRGTIWSRMIGTISPRPGRSHLEEAKCNFATVQRHVSKGA